MVLLLFLGLLGMILLALLLGWRWFDAQGPRLWARASRLWSWLHSRPALMRLRERYPRSWSWLGRRLQPGGYLGLHLTVGFLLSMAALAGFGSLASQIALQGKVIALDTALAEALAQQRSPLGQQAFRALTMLGSVPVLTLVGFGAALVLVWLRQWLLVLGVVLAMGGGGLLNLELKALFQRTRPETIDPSLLVSGWSFPSGHAMGSLIGYGIVAYLLVLWLPRHWDRLIIAASAALVLLIGFSRLYLGVHYLSDVIAGYAAGSVWLVVCITGMEVVRRRRSTRRLH